jgi:hypothetical protein
MEGGAVVILMRYRFVALASDIVNIGYEREQLLIPLQVRYRRHIAVPALLRAHTLWPRAELTALAARVSLNSEGCNASRSLSYPVPSSAGVPAKRRS